jgi:hypothetical protein
MDGMGDDVGLTAEGYCQRRRDGPGLRLPPQEGRNHKSALGCQVGRIDFRSDERNDIEGRLRQERGIEGEGEGWWMVWLTQGRAVLRSPYLGERERGDEREGRVQAI